MTKRSKFIVFEGGEAVGKSSLIQLFCHDLEERGVPCVHTYEPGGTPFADRIRKCFKVTAADPEKPTALAELFLIAASRAQHVERKIAPALARGDWVVCDRFCDSTFVYQGMARNQPLDFGLIKKVNLFATQGVAPHFTVFLDLDPLEAKRRIAQDPNREDSWQDAASVSFFERVRQGFLDRYKKALPHAILLDGSRSSQDLLVELNTCLENRGFFSDGPDMA